MEEAMSEGDVKELWDAIGGIRDGQRDMLVILAKIEASLAERCSNRLAAIERLAHRQDGLESRIGAVEDGQIKLFVYAGMVGAAAVAALKWAFSLLAKAFV